jgi:hypothetical protein
MTHKRYRAELKRPAKPKSELKIYGEESGREGEFLYCLGVGGIMIPLNCV